MGVMDQADQILGGATTSPTVIRQKFVIDESGSMSGQRNVVISGFNEQLDTMAAEQLEKNVRYLVTLTKFADEAKIVFTDLPLEEVPRLSSLSYNPSGFTALYDAIGITIDRATPGEMAVVTIMTDGMENRSKEWKKTTIQALINTRQKDDKWAFVYFGANQDAWQAAQSMNIRNAVNYTASNTGSAMKSMTSVRRLYTASVVQKQVSVDNLTAEINKEDLVK